MELPPPVVLNTPLFVPEKLLMGPGPSNCSPRVLRALSQPVLGHLHIETTKVQLHTKRFIKYNFFGIVIKYLRIPTVYISLTFILTYCKIMGQASFDLQKSSDRLIFVATGSVYKRRTAATQNNGNT